MYNPNKYNPNTVNSLISIWTHHIPFIGFECYYFGQNSDNNSVSDEFGWKSGLQSAVITRQECLIKQSARNTKYFSPSTMHKVSFTPSPPILSHGRPHSPLGSSRSTPSPFVPSHSQPFCSPSTHFGRSCIY